MRVTSQMRLMEERRNLNKEGKRKSIEYVEVNKTIRKMIKENQEAEDTLLNKILRGKKKKMIEQRKGRPMEQMYSKLETMGK